LILFSTIVLEDITEKYPVSTNVGIAFAYCSYKDQSNDPKLFFTSFILQLARQREELFPQLVDFHTTNQRDGRKASSCTFDTLRLLVLSMVKEFQVLFIIFDALDECENRGPFIAFLRELVSDSEDDCYCVKLFVSSRREADIQSAFWNTPRIEIAATKIQQDIEQYVEFEIQRRIDNGQLRLKDTESLSKEILSTLSNRAGGMYVYLTCISGFQRY
jgi:hypothetical protein